MLDPLTLNTLRHFRAGVYDCFGARRDALFELLDAATVAGLVPSLAYLSVPPVHRRRWGSLYDALAAVMAPSSSGKTTIRLSPSWPRNAGIVAGSGTYRPR